MPSSNGSLKLFVGDLGDNRKSDLNRLFSKYGEISTIYIDENKHFGFVEFTSSIDAQRALEHTHNKTVNGSKLRVEYAKISRDNRRPLSRDRSPTSILYSQLQVTANRLPSMQAFRQNYYQHYPLTMTTNPITTSRGRSLTPPSFKQNLRLPPMHHLRSQDFYYHHHPTLYSDPTYYRTYGDPYLMQRLPPPAFLPSSPPPSSSSSSSRAYRNMYSSSGINRYTTNISASSSHHRRSRSRSRHRNSLSHRNRSSREQKRKRRTSSSSSSSSSSEQKRGRGPRTPLHRSRKRSRSSSDAASSTSNQKSSSSSSSSSSDSSSQDIENEDKRSSSRKSLDNDSDRKYSKRKTRE
ncbi:unnamed protein product [Rotaria sordida]|uniref:RRM domain-containing protein n=1 Tax=Rotaria sordida TaxID=392033 RepID=A0A818KPH5_9BILA|nr:unnamed protein product [Rotaria sordida]CAF3561011.1 unnamed protein product [Rotaria sordida]